MYWIFDRPYVDSVQLPLAKGPLPVSIILGSYLYFVLKLGPKLMSNREPFQLRGMLKAYNIFQIVFNAIILIPTIQSLFFTGNYDLSCLMVLPDDHEFKNYDRLWNYLYYLNKILDLIDTIVIVLRKKYNQISLLHLIHHVYMVAASYALIRFYGFGGHVIVTGLLNLIVHIVMYSYYYISSEYKHISQSLWFKKYITIFQMIQFTMMFGHSLWTLMQPSCNVSRPVVYLVMFMSAFMFVMFTNFYIHAYKSPKKITQDQKIK